MAEDFHLLFCDNVDWKHSMFREYVAEKLNEIFPEDYAFSFYHSQSLVARFEEDYTDTCKQLGARSVESWVKKKIRFDLVITDLDFNLDTRMGEGKTGIDIIKFIHNKKSKDTFWTEYIVLTAAPDNAELREWMDLSSEGLLRSENLIYFSRSASEEDWAALRKRVVALLRTVIDKKKSHLELITTHTPPTLYDVAIVHEGVPSNPSNPLGVFIKEKGDGGAYTHFLLVGVESYTFKTLVEIRASAEETKAEVPFLEARILAKRVTEVFQRDDPLNTKKTFGGDAVKNHIEDIRSKINQSPVLLKNEDRQLEAVGTTHPKYHRKGQFCGHCVILHRSKNPRGYALAASPTNYRVARGTIQAKIDELIEKSRR